MAFGSWSWLFFLCQDHDSSSDPAGLGSRVWVWGSGNSCGQGSGQQLLFQVLQASLIPKRGWTLDWTQILLPRTLHPSPRSARTRLTPAFRHGHHVDPSQHALCKMRGHHVMHPTTATDFSAFLDEDVTLVAPSERIHHVRWSLQEGTKGL